MDMRLEKDSMGELEVPSKALYGGNTRRAQLNFPISNLRFGRSFIKSLGLIKQSAAETNLELGLIEKDIANAIISSAQEVIDGDHDESFVVDIFQTGSGTSTNMNVNEVISNLSILKLGGEIGSRNPVHPNDHVNKGQSSNDVIPTAIHIAAAISIKDDLIPSMKILESSLEKKSKEFWEIVKTGRTHLQDATPIRLGQEFKGYLGQVKNSINKIELALNELSILALGGTAVGTGIGMNPEFCGEVIKKIGDKTGIKFSETDNHFQSQSTIDGIVFASGIIRSYAVSLMKIANDIRWLGSGPRAGIGEISLPEVQPGSSIMPGKVNPVIAESITMICAQVMGNDQTVSIAGQSGNFELNVMMPVAAHNLLESIEILSTGSKNFSEQCIDGLEATTKGPQMVNQGLAICTALAPKIGYDKAADIAHKASLSGETIKEVALKETDLSSDDLDVILEPLSMTEPK
ncbi:MAG: class II fumarate hydratase [Chloroflexota bacterium]|jgi:fumarate hydratase class II|nr:aspartate ammonia-lyase [Chloroflexota bacterium]MQF83307.1 class II fumarate hydratase [SAR202 cluster bacterium]MEC7919949.1 class II fumarate hydratase [Chloroflexota bacterium]MEC9099588.1 class II fumarate hydratase [Chloroflexota bacterium]MEC9106913.1 class II fumarate hydratase [Chloroflexota bacterium]|tara:strand:+ start:470 stop:1855 length:1386 start_codon:yes stop_codon:yes gene_type:complete